jgi:hypothetical protein
MSTTITFRFPAVLGADLMFSGPHEVGDGLFTHEPLVVVNICPVRHFSGEIMVSRYAYPGIGDRNQILTHQ